MKSIFDKIKSFATIFNNENETNSKKFKYKKFTDMDISNNLVYLSPFNPERKTFLIVDENSLIINMLAKEFDSIKEKFNVIAITNGYKTGMVALEFISTTKINLDYCIFDIILDDALVTINNEYRRVTGVDLAILLSEKQPLSKFKFYTAVNIHDKSLVKKQFEDYFVNKFFKDYVIVKDEKHTIETFLSWLKIYYHKNMEGSEGLSNK